jgi:microcystin-dependent protein
MRVTIFSAIAWLSMTFAGLSADDGFVGMMRAYSGPLNSQDWAYANGSCVSRRELPELLHAIAPVLAVGEMAGSDTLTGDFSNPGLRLLNKGAAVEGEGILPGTFVIISTNSKIQLSAPAELDGQRSLTFFPLGNCDGRTTFALPNMPGWIIKIR